MQAVLSQDKSQGTTTSAPGTPLDGKAICIRLAFSMPGSSRGISSSTIEKIEGEGNGEDESSIRTDRALLHLKKDIFKSDRFEKIKKLTRALRSWLLSKTLPSPFNRGGVYILPLGFIEKVDERLEESKIEFFQAVDAFVSAWSEVKAEAKQRLGTLYVESDYPSEAEVKDRFNLTWNYITFNTPESLKQISAKVWEKEQARASSMWDEALAQAKMLLRSQMKMFVDRIQDRLSPSRSYPCTVCKIGKGEACKNTNGANCADRPVERKIFKAATVDRLAEFLEDFQARDVAGDESMAKIVKRASKLLRGVQIETLRSDEDLRTSVAAGFEKIQNLLDPLIIKTPTRAIDVSALDD